MCASALRAKLVTEIFLPESSESTAVLDNSTPWSTLTHNHFFSSEGHPLKESSKSVIAKGSKKPCLRFVHRSSVTCFVISPSLR
jgi:hypothetical protein